MIDIYENIENGIYEINKQRPRAEDFESNLAYQSIRAKYIKEKYDLLYKFRADLAEYNGITGHPKEETIYNMAYDWANGSSRRELAERYEKLADFVK